ncbi:MAG: DNA gyrase inhibitor YacG [Rhodoferax sp.]|nr:DNA gyrase inhibitor YacG [Rhodoferax sp.]
MTLHPAPSSRPATSVRCPGCGNPAMYSSTNAYRPFCSERCKALDLGAWASESFRLADRAREDDDNPSAQ